MRGEMLFGDDFKITKEDLIIENMNTVVLDKDGNEIANLSGEENRTVVSKEEMPEYLPKAFVSIEDERFYQHHGVDIKRTLGATFQYIINGGSSSYGGSTITQQLVKNLTADKDDTGVAGMIRKVKEMSKAYQVERLISKDQILELYLNIIFLGDKAYGVEVASKYYFNKSAEDLSLAESSMLAGIPGSPQEYSPINNETKAKKRQRVILDSMVTNGYITKKEADAAYNVKLTYHGKKDTLNLSTLMYYKDAVMNELDKIDIIPNDYLDTNGIKIYTNLDVNAQTYLENAVTGNIKSDSDIQTSSVMVENKTGKVIALVGGKNYEKSQYNRAVYSKRQVGSTMKPFLYYAALEDGFTASSTFSCCV